MIVIPGPVGASMAAIAAPASSRPDPPGDQQLRLQRAGREKVEHRRIVDGGHAVRPED